MDLTTLTRIAEAVDPRTARAFIGATRNVIDALMIENARVTATQTPGQKDYATASLPDAAPPGGWISTSEARATLQKMTEAVTLEKWTEGFIAAIQLVKLMA